MLVHNTCGKVTSKKSTKRNQNTPKILKSKSTPSNAIDKLLDGSSMKIADALDLASEFLGKGYTEPVHGSGRFVSADGARVFRMGENDILGEHGGGLHVNLEILEPNPIKSEKMRVKRNIHIFLDD